MKRGYIFDEVIFSKFVLIILLITTVLLIGKVYYTDLANQNNNVCDTNKLTLDKTVKNYSSTITLNNNNDYYIQEYDVGNYKTIFLNKALYCVYLTVNGSGSTIQLINEQLEVLDTSIVSVSGEQCFEAVRLSNFMGLSCVDCNTSNNEIIVRTNNNNLVPTKTIINNTVTISDQGFAEAYFFNSFSCEKSVYSMNKIFYLVIIFSLILSWVFVAINSLQEVFSL